MKNPRRRSRSMARSAKGGRDGRPSRAVARPPLMRIPATRPGPSPRHPTGATSDGSDNQENRASPEHLTGMANNS